MNSLKEFDFNCWDPIVNSSLSDQVIAALEGGQVVVLPHLAFNLLPEEERFLSSNWSDKKAKNISLRPNAGLRGATGSELDMLALRGMIERFADQSQQLISKILPSYVPNLTVANTSFRPFEVEARMSSYRKDDTRLHPDAFPSNPTQGTRLLRVFNNVNPNGKPRVWRVGEPFTQMANQFLPKTKALLPLQAWLMKTLHITKRTRTEYDHRMLQLHDLVKADMDYQKNSPQQSVNFMPGTTWIVYSDQVLHAAMSGQYMFEQTFHLPVSGLKNPETAPLRVLEKMLKRSLIN
ncbi:MAG: Kdo hydroxylase family protein [Methylophilaceae bacterium]